MMVPFKNECPLPHLPANFNSDHPLFDAACSRWIICADVPDRLSYEQVFECSEWLMPGGSLCVAYGHYDAQVVCSTLDELGHSRNDRWLCSLANTGVCYDAFSYNSERFDLLGFLLLFWPKVKAVDPQTILALSALEEYETIARIVKEVCR